jgi:hypothetical protein
LIRASPEAKPWAKPKSLPARHPGFDSGFARSKALGKAQVFARMTIASQQKYFIKKTVYIFF